MLIAAKCAIRKGLQYGAIAVSAVACMPVASHAQSQLPVIAPVVSCAALKAFDLGAVGGAGSRINSSIETTSAGIAVCSVEGVLAPAIQFRILLPIKTWTQRYLQVGCGGLCGSIDLQSGASNGCRVLSAGGFAMAATDMGHSGMDDAWARDAQKQIDFAYRAQHLTAQAAKALIQAFYGQKPKFSYFNGCSDGGREALMEAQRYPRDFDGIIAGAPAMLFQVQNTLYHGWQAVSNTSADGKVVLLSHKLPVLHRTVVDACDVSDGLKDGLIANPAACRFDFATVTCKPDTSDTTACLTPDEAEVARRLYDGPKDAKSGAHLTAGQPLYGSELNWQGVYVADTADGTLMSAMAALPVLRYLAFKEAKPDLQLRGLAFTEATLAALRPRHPLFDATNTDLTAFAQAGGKLILWHGLADPHIAPANTVAFHTSMTKKLGAANLDAFERLYLLPGVSHCGGGQGPSNLDLLSGVMAWVEQGKAPDAILTASTRNSSTFGQPDFSGDAKPRRAGPPAMNPLDVPRLPPMTRPVYPYPYVARFKGVGSYADAANWEKGEASDIVQLHAWPGADLFGPYTPSPD